MRQGDCFGETVDRVDFLRKTLTDDRQLVAVAHREPFLAEPKTAASVRTIPLPRVVVNALAAHLAAFPVGPDGLLFTTDDGKPVRRTFSSAQVWRPAVKASDVPAGTRFHDWRHYYATLLIARGEREDGPVPARACERGGDAGHLQPSLAGQRRPDP